MAVVIDGFLGTARVFGRACAGDGRQIRVGSSESHRAECVTRSLNIV